MIKRSMLALTLTGSALATAATAQTAATPASPQVPGAQPGDAVPDEAPENTVVVTGTRALGRTLAQSPVPIDVISSEALQSSGLGETNKILNSLVPSFNFPQPSITDGTDVIRPASLRGLAPDQTLILVNGKRRHVTALLNVNGSVGRGSAAVDLNTIPAIAIDRIELLRDGVSSQYGYDAIAGVINVQLRRNRTGGRVQMSYGKYDTTLAGVADVTGLQSQANGQPFLDPNDTRVFAVNTNGQRHVVDGSLFTYAANLGVAIGGEGYLNLSAEYRDRDPTNRSGADIRSNYNRTNTGATGPFDARGAMLGRVLVRYGDAATKDYNLFLNAAVPLGTLELYAFGSFPRRNGSSAANRRQSLTANNRDYSVITAATAPTTANFAPLRSDCFLPFINPKLTDYSAALGVRGDVGPFKSDLSVVYGDNRFDYRTENSLNPSFGPASPSSFDDGGLELGQLTANLDLSHEFELGFAKPVTFAFGGEYRHERFQIFPGEVASYAAGPFLVAAQTTTAANCAAQGGVFNATAGICAFPGRAAAVGAQGFPGFPATARTDARRSSEAGSICRRGSPPAHSGVSA